MTIRLASLALLLGAAPALAAPMDFRTPAAAVAVVKGYYSALACHDYHSAYAAWDRGGQASRQSFPAFRAGFAKTRSVWATVGTPTNGEGAAGSSYIDVPVDVRAVLASGRRQHFRGTYTLRRVNDVDGATRMQRHWHLASAKLSVVR